MSSPAPVTTPDGLMRCQYLVDDHPCGGLMIITPDDYAVCEHSHGRLFHVNKDIASQLRRNVQDHLHPSEERLEREWKRTLPVATKVGNCCIAGGKVRVYRISDRPTPFILRNSLDVISRHTKISVDDVAAVLVTGNPDPNRRSLAARAFTPISLSDKQLVRLKFKEK